MKNLLNTRMAAALALGLAIAACGGGGATTTVTTSATTSTQGATATTTTEPVEQAVLLFGAATSLSGDLADWGQAQRNSIELWAKMVNESGGLTVGDTTYQIQTIFKDTQSNPDNVAALVEELLTDDKVNFLFGPVSSLQVGNMQALADQYQIPSVNTFAFVTDIYRKGFKYSFSAQPGTASQYVNLFEMLGELGVKTIAIAAVNNPLGEAFVKEVTHESETLGVEILATEVYPAETTDFSTILTKFAGLAPDVVAQQDTLGPTIEFRKQQVAQGLSFPLVYVESGPNVEGWEAAGEAGELVVSQTAWDPSFVGHEPDDQAFWGTNADFVRLYEEAYGTPPTWAAAVTANATEIYTRALTAAGTIDPVAVRDAIAGLTGDSFYGPIKFDEGGLNEGPAAAVAVVQWQSGQRVVVYPSDLATGEIVYPAQ